MTTVNIEFKPSEENKEDTDIYVGGVKVFVYGTRDYFELETMKKTLQDVYNLGYSAGIKEVTTHPSEQEDSCAADEDGWIPWHSTTYVVPVNLSTTVEVKFRDGGKDKGEASEFSWKTIDSEYDIVAYRVITE